MRKKDRSPCLFRRKQSLIDLVNLSSKETSLVRTVRALVRALMTQGITLIKKKTEGKNVIFVVFL